MTSVVLDRPKTPVSPATFPKRESARHLPSRKLAASAFAFFVGLMAVARVWRERQRTRRQLAIMSERELQDIGTCRSEIACEIAKPFWRAVDVSNAARQFSC